jgi:hypothetical protein
MGLGRAEAGVLGNCGGFPTYHFLSAGPGCGSWVLGAGCWASERGDGGGFYVLQPVRDGDAA